MAQHKFTAEAAYGFGGKQWIARITGRVSTAATFERDFVGTKCGKRGELTTAAVDEPGLYETCDVDRKGNKDYSYAYFDGERVSDWRAREQAMDLARHLDDLELYERPARDGSGETIVDVRVRQTETPVQTAARLCREALSGLSPEERAAVIVGLTAADS